MTAMRRSSGLRKPIPGGLDGEPGTDDVLSAGQLMRHDVDGDQLEGFPVAVTRACPA
jgi:hypothetical protein